jgi:hypothetical protein
MRANLLLGRWLFAGRCAALVALSTVMLGVCVQAIAAERGPSRENFDHTLTGFPLTGAHSQATCESCHSFGVFKGTPRQCQLCHAPGSGRATTAKPSNHIPTAEPCAQCHNSTVTWAGARFRHTGVAPGTCATCHNGAQASGKPPNHVITTSSCDTCHRTTAWLPATFSHTAVAPGTCATCHNGTTARGKPANHIQTTASCDQCHRTTAWLPATFSHTAVAPGTCATCHNGTQATGKPSGHFVTTRSCDACHTTSAWLPVTRYTHTSPYYKAHNTGVTCAGCHTTNNEVISWKFSAYKPDCAGCHADRFKPDAHKKVDTPKILYTVNELRNCSGSCHVYTDTTFTTIKTTRSSKHRSTDGGF